MTQTIKEGSGSPLRNWFSSVVVFRMSLEPDYFRGIRRTLKSVSSEKKLKIIESARAFVECLLYIFLDLYRLIIVMGVVVVDTSPSLFSMATCFNQLASRARILSAADNTSLIHEYLELLEICEITHHPM
jgi:uncharacterized membrane protein